MTVERTWHTGDVIELSLPIQPRAHQRTQRNAQESRGPDGEPISQEVLRFDYVAVTRGPLVYSTGLIDGYKVDETVRLPSDDPWLARLPGDEIEMRPVGRAPLLFQPYYRAGGRQDGAWRLTWLTLAPESKS
jgi:hypothetical protein